MVLVQNPDYGGEIVCCCYCEEAEGTNRKYILYKLRIVVIDPTKKEPSISPSSSIRVINIVSWIRRLALAPLAVSDRSTSPMEARWRSILPYSLFLLFVATAFSPAAAAANGDGKVQLVLYYETLCPYCSNFIVNGLSDVFENGLISIIDLRLVPYGNARIRSNKTISCQHGTAECLLNTVEACAIDTWPQLKDHFPLIYCIEKLVYEHKYPQWESCFDKLGLESKPVLECYTGGRGNELELGYADETGALDPPHEYVPWVTVNGTPLYEDYEDFMRYICAAYKGVSAPEVCSKLSLKSTTDPKKNTPKIKVCNKTKSSPSFRSFINQVVESVMNVIG